MEKYSNLFSELLNQQLQSIETSVNLLLSLETNDNLSLIQEVYHRIEFSIEAIVNLLFKTKEVSTDTPTNRDLFKSIVLKSLLNVVYQKTKSLELKTFIYQKLDNQSSDSLNNKILGLISLLSNE